MAYNLEKITAIADRRIKETVYSSLFARCPLVAFMLGLGGSKSNLMRPGVMGLISGAKIPAVKRASVDGGITTDVEIITAKSGGGKTRTARDTNPAVEQSQDQNLGSARFWWWFYSQPVKVWRSTLLLSGKGQYVIQNALTKAVDMARDEMIDTLASKIWTGAPSTYNVTANNGMYDDLPGVVECMSETNTYGNVNRSETTEYIDGVHPWASNRETNARAATIDLIDEANDVCQVYGDGVELVLTTRAIYRKLKKEALAKNGTICFNGNIPGRGMVGYKREVIQYGDCFLTFDPFCPTGYMGCFTLSDWEIEMHPEAKFTTEPWQINNLPGADWAMTSNINIGLRPYCTRPRNQYLFTNVTTS